MKISLRTDHLLSGARRMIDRPDLWCQKAMSRSVDRAAVSPFDEDAVEFCVVGAIQRAAFNVICEYGNAEMAHKCAEQGSVLAIQCVDAAAVLTMPLPMCVNRYDGQRTEAFNDSRSHAEVLALLDSATPYGAIEVSDET